MDLKDIQNLIKFVAKSGASEVKLETEDIKITIKTGSENERGETTYIQQIPAMAQPQMQMQPQSGAAAPQPNTPIAEAAPADAADSKLLTIKSPIIGTFYRKPSPDKPVFVEVGSTVSAGDVLCVIEAMKLFNEIESEIKGRIVKILLDDASPVEYDQPLFLVEPI